MADIYLRLKNATDELFPRNGAWTSDKFAKDENSLQAHLRDTEWLTKKMKELLPDIDEDTIRVFVNGSDYFTSERAKYEQKVVKWQIEWMIGGGDNWLVKDEYGGDFIRFSPLYDIGFRKGILDTLLAIGMNEDAIEEGIERNASLWRDECMKIAFMNKYDPVDVQIRRSEIPYEHPTDEHLEQWLRLRRYQYYQVHKESVDAYGTQNNIMDITPEALRELTRELLVLDQERMNYLEEFKANSTYESFHLTSLMDEVNKVDSIPAAPIEPPVQPKKGIKSLVKKFFS